MKPRLAITLGDPAGIGPEVIIKALARPEIRGLIRPLVIGDRAVLERTARRLDLPLAWRSLAESELESAPARAVDLLEQKAVDPRGLLRGRPSAEGGRASYEAIRDAARLALNRRVAGIVTAPISKEALAAAGHPFPGHTELLATLAGVSSVGMLMVAPIPGPPRGRRAAQLRILLATTHVAIRDLPERLTRESIRTAIRLAHEAAVRAFGIRRPRLAVAGLNPHAGENGLFGREEIEVIGPAVAAARRSGLPVSGPFPADTLIRRAHDGEFDIVIAMYHDQALIPVKLLGFGRGVNMTAGLPFIRTSPDHGTAYDIAGKGIGDPGSLMEAIRLAAALSKSFNP